MFNSDELDIIVSGLSFLISDVLQDVEREYKKHGRSRKSEVIRTKLKEIHALMYKINVKRC